MEPSPADQPSSSPQPSSPAPNPEIDTRGYHESVLVPQAQPHLVVSQEKDAKGPLAPILRFLWKRHQKLHKYAHSELAATDAIVKHAEQALGPSLVSDRPPLAMARFNNTPPLAAVQASSTALEHELHPYLDKTDPYGLSINIVSGLYKAFKSKRTIKRLLKGLNKEKLSFEAALPTLYGMVNLETMNKILASRDDGPVTSSDDNVSTLNPDQVRNLIEGELQKISDSLQYQINEMVISVTSSRNRGAEEIVCRVASWLQDETMVKIDQVAGIWREENQRLIDIVTELHGKVEVGNGINPDQVRELVEGEVKKISDTLQGQMNEMFNSAGGFVNHEAKEIVARLASLLQGESAATISQIAGVVREENQRLINTVTELNVKSENNSGLLKTGSSGHSPVDVSTIVGQHVQRQTPETSSTLAKIVGKGFKALTDTTDTTIKQATLALTETQVKVGEIALGANAGHIIVSNAIAGFGAHYARGSRNANTRSAAAAQRSATASERSSAAAERSATASQRSSAAAERSAAAAEAQVRLNVEKFEYEKLQEAAKKSDGGDSNLGASPPREGDSSNAGPSTTPPGPPQQGSTKLSQRGSPVTSHLNLPFPSTVQPASHSMLTSQERAKKLRELENVKKVKKAMKSTPRTPAKKATSGLDTSALKRQIAAEQKLSATLEHHRRLDSHKTKKENPHRSLRGTSPGEDGDEETRLARNEGLSSRAKGKQRASASDLSDGLASETELPIMSEDDEEQSSDDNDPSVDSASTWINGHGDNSYEMAKFGSQVGQSRDELNLGAKWKNNRTGLVLGGFDSKSSNNKVPRGGGGQQAHSSIDPAGQPRHGKGTRTRDDAENPNRSTSPTKPSKQTADSEIYPDLASEQQNDSTPASPSMTLSATEVPQRGLPPAIVVPNRHSADTHYSSMQEVRPSITATRTTPSLTLSNGSSTSTWQQNDGSPTIGPADPQIGLTGLEFERKDHGELAPGRVPVEVVPSEVTEADATEQ